MGVGDWQDDDVVGASRRERRRREREQSCTISTLMSRVIRESEAVRVYK